jgi:hypothetical protein
MTEDEFIIELWARLKPFIGAKDRMDAADAVIAVCDEFGFIDGIEVHPDLDKALRAAIKSRLGSWDEDEDEDGGW